MANPANETVVRDMMRRLDDGDPAGAAMLFADQGTNHGIAVTRDGIELVLRSLQQAMPDARTEIIDMISDGEVVACRAHVEGTHLGTPDLPFVEGGVFAMGPPTGRRVSTTHQHWFRIRDGVVIEHWANRDDLGLARQLGLIEGLPTRT